MKGLVLVTLNGKTFQNSTRPIPWNLMLRGPRAGYDNFNLSSPLLALMKSKPGIDSLLGSKPFTQKLLKSCDTNPSNGFYYYQVKLPQKITSYIKIAWNINASGGRIIIDCYDNHSKQYADLNCR